MKLCIITPNVMKGDGQSRANYEIIREALRRGHDVTLLAKRVASEILEHKHVSLDRVFCRRLAHRAITPNCLCLA